MKHLSTIVSPQTGSESPVSL